MSKSQFFLTSIRLSLVVIFGMYFSSSGFKKVYVWDTIARSESSNKRHTSHAEDNCTYTSCISHLYRRQSLLFVLLWPSLQECHPSSYFLSDLLKEAISELSVIQQWRWIATMSKNYLIYSNVSLHVFAPMAMSMGSSSLVKEGSASYHRSRR